MRIVSLLYIFIAFQGLSSSCVNASVFSAPKPTWVKGSRVSLVPIGRSSQSSVAPAFSHKPLPAIADKPSTNCDEVSKVTGLPAVLDASPKDASPPSCFSPKASAAGTPDEIVPMGRTTMPQSIGAVIPAPLTFGASGSSADFLPGTTDEKVHREAQPERGSLARLPSMRTIANPPSLPQSPAHRSRKSSVYSIDESWGIYGHRHRRSSSIKAMHDLLGHKRNASCMPSQLLTLKEIASPNETFLAAARTNNIKRMKYLKGFANFNAVDGNGNTALINAVTNTAQLDKRAVVAFLIAQPEVNVNLQNDKSRTALHEVCNSLDEETLDDLLKSDELDVTILDYENRELSENFRYTARHYLKQKSELNGEQDKQKKAKRMLKKLDRYFIRQIETIEKLKDKERKYSRIFKKLEDYEHAQGIDRYGFTEDSPVGCCG